TMNEKNDGTRSYFAPFPTSDASFGCHGVSPGLMEERPGCDFSSGFPNTARNTSPSYARSTRKSIGKTSGGPLKASRNGCNQTGAGFLSFQINAYPRVSGFNADGFDETSHLACVNTERKSDARVPPSESPSWYRIDIFFGSGIWRNLSINCCLISEGIRRA